MDPYQELYTFLNTLYTEKILTGEGFDHLLDVLNKLVDFDGGQEFPESLEEIGEDIVNSSLEKSIMITNGEDELPGEDFSEFKCN